MTPSMLRRQLKNLVQNYSEAEVKVREATSNDPWGPSSSQMADISDLTYNVVACNEIMTMLWKRLKDDKNWRHIHKSLTLLEYLLKTGDDRVLLKMKDNIYIVKALTEYRFVEKDGKDQGTNVREKAKVVLVLMEDDEKLKEERAFAVKTREKTSKSSAAASEDPIKDPNYKPCFVPGATGLPCLDNIPSVADLTASFTARKEERLKQEAEKREVERRAKMTEDELQWEDAGKTSKVREGAWGTGKTEEEVKTDAWGVPVEPKEATGPWGTPGIPDTTVTDANSEAKTEDPFEAPRNGEGPFAEESASFSASKEDPFSAPKDTSDAFSAPTHKEDPFAAPKDKPDPFNAPKDDPFNAPKDDPFNAPKDDPFNAPKDDPFNASKDDPFNASKDDPFNASKDDPFNAPKDDPFNAPKDDPFNAPKDDPFTTPKDDPFNAPKDDPFIAPKDDPFSAPKDDPFNAPKDDPFSTPKDDPFSAVKEDPFNTPKDDPFIVSASTPPKEDPFAASVSPKDDPFTVTSPPMKDPFSAPSKPTQDDHFIATTPPKKDPFTVTSSPPKDSASDPFSAPPLSSPQGSSDPWEAPSAPNGTRSGDPWGDLPSTSSTVENSEGFGDVSKADNDPWGAPAAAPINTDDAWGSPAPPSDSSPSSDPFGDTSSKGDPWSAPSSTPHNETGKPTLQEKDTHRKTASFLGAVGASLVDLDNLFSSYTKVRQRPLVHSLNTQMQAIGTLKASCPTSGAVAGVTHCSPFGIGEENPSSKTPLLQLPYSTTIHSCSGSHTSQMAPLCSERVHSPSVGVGPQVEFNMNTSCGGAGMPHSGSSVRNQLIDPLIVGTGMSNFSYSGVDPRAGGALLGRLSPKAEGGIFVGPQWLLGSKSKKNNNPFLF